jgi:hypothetical protein
MKWLSADAPSTWSAVTMRAVTVVVIAFVVLQAKEYFDAGAFDTPATSVDAALVGAGTFLVYAVLKWGKFSRGGAGR